MPSATDRIDFGPPPDAGALRSFGLALLVHAALIAALTWGVNWKRSDRSVAFEAELWSSMPQEAAPKLIDVQPPPAPSEPTPKVLQAPPALSKPSVAPKVEPPAEPRVDIALEQEKKRKLIEKQKLEDQTKAEAKAEAMAKAKAQAKAKANAEARAEKEVRLKAAEDAKKLDKKKQEQKDQKEQANAAQLEAQRKQNLARMIGQTGATGSETARGTAQTSSGPSANYQSKLAALFKRNITFSNPQSISGNPKAIVQVKASSTGLIMSSRLSKSSGVPAWDEAVLRAVEKTERIPLDENGRIVSDFPVEFGPKD